MPKATSSATKPARRRGTARRPPLRRRRAQRDAWLRQIDPASLIHSLFAHLPDLHFFAKNRRGELMITSSIGELYGFRDDSELIGLTDFDLNPASMAQGYVDDDARIYRTGEPVLQRIELWWDAQGVPNWYRVTKLPIHSRQGRIIGIMGFLQRYEGQVQLAMPWREIDAAVRYLRERFRGPVPLADLAQHVGLSVRQLERKFRAILGVSPQEFLIKTRILAACHALRHTTTPLADIATDCGFYDQSSFTEQFRRYVGQTPREFRQAAFR